MKRKDGYYWVRVNKDEWVISQLISGIWYFHNSDFYCDDDFLEEIGEEIENNPIKIYKFITPYIIGFASALWILYFIAK